MLVAGQANFLPQHEVSVSDSRLSVRTVAVSKDGVFGGANDTSLTRSTF